jgi:hypothetical protein
MKSKLVGIGRWLQRRLLWMTGLADDIISGQITILTNNDPGDENLSDNEI